LFPRARKSKNLGPRVGAVPSQPAAGRINPDGFGKGTGFIARWKPRGSYQGTASAVP